MRLRARHAVVPVIAALVLVGCARPGTAAIVDGERITDGQVAAVSDDLARLGIEQPVQNVIFRMVTAETILDVVDEAGAAVSEAQVRAQLDSFATQSGVEPFDYSAGTLQVMTAAFAFDQADDEVKMAVQEGVSALTPTVNPRFGAWEAGNLEVTVWPWLVPSAAPAAG